MKQYQDITVTDLPWPILEAPRHNIVDMGDILITHIPATCAIPSFNVTPWLWAVSLSLLIALGLTLFAWAWDMHKTTKRLNLMRKHLKGE